MIEITLDQFKRMIPSNKDVNSWYQDAIPLLKKYEVNTRNRVAAFIAQTSHESTDFTHIVENMNYSAQRLREVFPRYFQTINIALEYARQPEKIANRVYADENRTSKLGNIYLGDGWRFRGSGIIQLTGRDNFDRFGKTIDMTAEEAAEYARTKAGALETALWFWKTNDLNQLADSNDIDAISKRVNGGRIGVQERRNRYLEAQKILQSAQQVKEETIVAPKVNPVIVPEIIEDKPVIVESVFENISKGSNQFEKVKKIQSSLKILSDGQFGVNTEKAVKSWQRKNKFTANGLIDEIQYKKLVGE